MFWRLFCNILILYCILGLSAAKADLLDVWIANRVYSCSISGNPVDFGLISDTNLNNRTLTTKVSADCNRNTIWYLLPVYWGAYCLTIQGGWEGEAFAGTRVLKNWQNPNSKIYFDFYNASNPDLPIGQDYDDGYGFMTGIPYVGLLDSFVGHFAMDFPVSVRLFNSSAGGGDGSIGGGVYSNTFIAQLRYGASGNVFSPTWRGNSKTDCYNLPKGPTSGTITVRATVKSSCEIKVSGHINFGPMPDYQLRNGNVASGEVAAKCSNGASYQVGLAKGLHKDKAIAGSRAMQRKGSNGKDAADFIAYGLYQDNTHSMPWTDKWGSAETVKGKGRGDWDTYPVHAFVPPQAEAKNAGHYEDIVVVEVHINAQ